VTGIIRGSAVFRLVARLGLRFVVVIAFCPCFALCLGVLPPKALQSSRELPIERLFFSIWALVFLSVV
jgi:hypothetical protein